MFQLFVDNAWHDNVVEKRVERYDNPRIFAYSSPSSIASSYLSIRERVALKKKRKEKKRKKEEENVARKKERKKERKRKRIAV